MFLFTCAGVVRFDGALDRSTLLNQLAESLRREDACDIRVSQESISFRGGMFRLVDRWNALALFGYGELFVDDRAREVRYRISARQFVVLATVWAALGTVLMLRSAGQLALYLGAVFWSGLVFGSLAIATTRFRDFLERALQIGSCSRTE